MLKLGTARVEDFLEPIFFQLRSARVMCFGMDLFQKPTTAFVIFT